MDAQVDAAVKEQTFDNVQRRVVVPQVEEEPAQGSAMHAEKLKEELFMRQVDFAKRVPA